MSSRCGNPPSVLKRFTCDIYIYIYMCVSIVGLYIHIYAVTVYDWVGFIRPHCQPDRQLRQSHESFQSIESVTAINIHIHIYTYVRVHICTDTHMYRYTHIHICTYIHTQLLIWTVISPLWRVISCVVPLLVGLLWVGLWLFPFFLNKGVGILLPLTHTALFVFNRIIIPHIHKYIYAHTGMLIIYIQIYMYTYT